MNRFLQYRNLRSTISLYILCTVRALYICVHSTSKWFCCSFLAHSILYINSIHTGNKTGRKVLAKTIFKYNEKISYLTQENIQCNISLFTRKIEVSRAPGEKAAGHAPCHSALLASWEIPVLNLKSSFLIWENFIPNSKILIG